jgi:hypothetical protein
MLIDPIRVVVFLHVLLFAYWLGSDLGVFVCGLFARSKTITPDARGHLMEAGALIDMAPRTCLVLMAPVGLTLAVGYGSPIHGVPLALVWVAALAWLWLVWQVHFKHDQPLGKLLWKIDFGIRSLVMAAFVAFGGWCLATGGPISSRWLSVKILLFGLIILAGIIVRLLLLAPAATAAVPAAGARDGRSRIRQVVFVIWGLVAAAAFLGVARPF